MLWGLSWVKIPHVIVTALSSSLSTAKRIWSGFCASRHRRTWLHSVNCALNWLCMCQANGLYLQEENNIQSISITPDCTGPWDKEGSQTAPPLRLKGLPGRPASLHPVWSWEPSLRLKAGTYAAQYLRHANSAWTITQISSECVLYIVVVYTCVYTTGGSGNWRKIYGHLKSSL